LQSTLMEAQPSLPSPVVSTTSSITTRRGFANLRAHLLGDVDPALSTGPLSAYCFMTGFIDSISFSAVFIWCAFQTGNSVQLALALARLFEGNDHSFHKPDQQALCSVLTFLLGASIGRIGDKVGPRTRLWLFLGTMIQALFTTAAAIAIWQSGQGSIASNRGNPAWTNALSFVCLGFMSATMGLQGIMGKRVNTQFATTIVLTTVWCEVMADPKLFDRRRTPSRDHKFLAIFVLFLGGFVGRAILAQIGSAGALGVGTGMRVLVAFSWLFVKGQSPATSSKR